MAVTSLKASLYITPAHFQWTAVYCVFSVLYVTVAYPGILFFWGGVSNSVVERGQRERASGRGSPLVRGSGGCCNLVQEISFHIVKLS